MRPTLSTLAAALLAVTFAAPVAAVVPGGAIEETLTGTLEAVHVDEFKTGREHEEYLLRTPRGLIPLKFADGGPVGRGGATVTVTGTRAGKALRIDSSRPGRTFRVTRMPTAGETTTMQATDSAAAASAATVTTTSLEAATAAAPVAKSIAVVLINFTNLATQPYTKTAVQSALTGGGTSVKAFFEEESKGRMSVAGSVFGWYTINASTTGCDWPTWHTLGWNAATAGGVDLNAYTNVMFLWPNTSQCGFAGLGYAPGSFTYLNGTTNVQVMTHELGHNMGLGHANARNCTVGGTRVTIAAAANCTTQVYADPFSTMGNNALRHNHGSQLGELGWLEASEKVIGEPGNTYTIVPYFGAGGVKLVRVPRGDGSFFDLDVRTPYGSFDNYAAGSPAVTGVTIRAGLGTASPTNAPKGTELLDTTPSTADLKDAPLLVGRTMTDPVSGISFKSMSVSSAGVVVRVGESIAPSAPGSLSATATATPSVTLAWTAATDNVAVGSYRITRDGTQVATPAASATSWTDASAQLGATYAYAVAAVDTSGNEGPAVSASATMPAPPAPTPAPSADPAAQQPPTPDPTGTAGAGFGPDAGANVRLGRRRTRRPDRACRHPHGDVGAPDMDRVHGRCGGDWVSDHAGRNPHRHGSHHGHLRRFAHAANDLRLHGGRRRRGGARQPAREHDGHHGCGHDPAVETGQVPQGCAIRSLCHVRLAQIDRQRGRGQVLHLPVRTGEARRDDAQHQDPHQDGLPGAVLRACGGCGRQPELPDGTHPRSLTRVRHPPPSNLPRRKRIPAIVGVCRRRPTPSSRCSCSAPSRSAWWRSGSSPAPAGRGDEPPTCSRLPQRSVRST